MGIVAQNNQSLTGWCCRRSQHQAEPSHKGGVGFEESELPVSGSVQAKAGSPVRVTSEGGFHGERWSGGLFSGLCVIGPGGPTFQTSLCLIMRVTMPWDLPGGALGWMGEAHREANTVGQILHKGKDQAGREILPLICMVDRCLFDQLLWVELCSRCWGHRNEQNREYCPPEQTAQ